MPGGQVVTLTTHGVVTVPKTVREALDFGPGTLFEVFYDIGIDEIILKILKKNPYED